MAYFGTLPLPMSFTAAGSTSALMVLSRPVWTLGASGWTLGVSKRSAVLFGEQPDEVSVRIEVADPDASAMVLLRSSADGRSGYEVGVVKEFSQYFLRARRVWEGAVVLDSGGTDPYLVNAASDIPNTPTANANLNVTTRLTAGEPFTVEARIAGGRIEVFLNDEGTPSIRHTQSTAQTPPAATGTFDPAGAGTFALLRHVGFVAAASGTVVRSVRVASLAGQRTSRDDMLVAVAAGDVWVSQDAAMVRVATGALPSTGPVEMREFNGRLYMIGGGQARVLDPLTLNVSPWVPTKGTLPGQETAGTTTAAVLGTHATRLVLAAAAGDEQNATFTAVADALDLDNGSDLPGRSFTLAGQRPLKVGQPIIGTIEASNSALIVGTSGSIQQVLGDPALGSIETQVLLDDTGISGPRSMVRAQEGVVVAHGPQGLMVIPVGGQPANISIGTLNVGITLDSTENMSVLVARDPVRFRTWVFMVPTDLSAGRHWCYDERVGGFAAGMGGFRPQSFPAAMQPLAACVWKGRLILGCADGYLREFDDAATTDDGEPITAYATMPLIGDGVAGDALMTDLRVLLTRNSGPTRVRVMTADTAESVLSAAGPRKVAQAMTARPHRHEPHPAGVRAPAIAVLIGPSDPGTRWQLEAIAATAERGLTRTRS